jgi:RNA polymerase sigma factor (sigma-70 family)
VLSNDGAGLTDGQLLEAFLRLRDDAALAALVKRHASMVWGVCRRVLSNHQDAEDAFQVTFLVLVRKASCVMPREMVANWLYGVARQTALKARATAAKRKTRERQVTDMPEPAITGVEFSNDLQSLLDEELSRLPDNYRAAIVSCDLQGKSYKEAAIQLGVPDGTLSARLTRGRAMLARRLARRGLTVSVPSLATVLAGNAAAVSAPAGMVTNTIKTTTLFATGEAATVLFSSRVVVLLEGVLKTMLLNKLKITTALAIALCICAGSALAFLPGNSELAEAPTKAGGRVAAKEAQPPTGRPQAPFPDLKQIDRTIALEPKYEKQPFYALLVFGPEAKKRVWLVVDGNTLYVDRNGNGDLTEAKKRIQESKKIEVAPSMYTHMNSFALGKVQGLQLQLDYWVRNRKFVPKENFDKKIFDDHEKYGWEFATLWRINADGTKSGQIPLCFCDRPRDAQICHLGGRLTFTLRSGADSSLVRNSDQSSLPLMIGTPGLPARNWRDRVFAPLGTEEVPANVHPVAEFEFPHESADQPPIKLRAALKQRC